MGRQTNRRPRDILEFDSGNTWVVIRSCKPKLEFTSVWYYYFLCEFGYLFHVTSSCAKLVTVAVSSFVYSCVGASWHPRGSLNYTF